MDLFQAMILGLIEGFTEFLPISSTGHMIVASSFLGIDQSAVNKSFEVIIQFSAIIAVMVNYKTKFSLKHSALWTKVGLAFLPVGVVGFLCHKLIKEAFTVPIVATMFIVGGVVFLVVEFFHKDHLAKTTDLENISTKQAMIIGLAQILSMIPGTSRAGSTIICGMLLGLNRKVSAEFSFLLALPVIGAATGYELLKSYKEFAGSNWLVLFVGFLVSFLMAFITIKMLLSLLQKFTFVGFGIYRIVFGALLLWLVWGNYIPAH